MTRLLPVLVLGHALIAGAQTPPAVIQSELVFPAGQFGGAHASTIVETRDGLLAAWFAGSREGASDVGIWTSRRVGTAWTKPVEVATGVQPDGTRYPCWNPVLFAMSDGSIALFYKVGPAPMALVGHGSPLAGQRPHMERCTTPCRTACWDRSRTSRCG